MANKENIVYLTRSQMRVLYYKCKEGATHEEIAEKLGRDVGTVQYHMTNIYAVLEIRQPGKSREAMEAELNREIAPIIRGMFDSIDDIKTWVPAARDRGSEEIENPDEEGDEPSPGNDPPSPYEPPPSVESVLGKLGNGQRPPEITQSPPPGRRRRNGWLIFWWTTFGLLIAILLVVLLLISYPSSLPMRAQPTDTRLPSSPAPLATPPVPTEVLANTSVPRQSPTFPTHPIVDTTDGMVLVPIPAGAFKMGSSRADDPQAYDEEIPQHVVYLDNYLIDQLEVSNVQYAMCVAAGDCTRPANNSSSTRGSYYDDSEYADYPVIFVSWDQAAAYCDWAGRRLPTEAEWEKAARGPDGRIYPWGNTFDGSLTNYCDINCPRDWRDKRFDDGYVETSTVGEYSAGASVYGVLDMSGNVYEWVADWYGPYDPGNQANPTGPATGQEKIMRGGAWGDDVAHVRSAVRSHLSGETWMDFIGFRCVRSPFPP